MATKKNTTSTSKKTLKPASDKMLTNGLTQLTSLLGFSQEFGVQLSQTATLIKNNRNYFISNDRTTLTYAYTTHGIIQTLIDQPIEDAFRGGLNIESDELDPEDIQKIQQYIRENNVMQEIKDLGKWDRLYGGGAMVINTVGKSDKPLNVNAINENTPLEFYASDLWELNKTNAQIYSEPKPYVKTGFMDEFFFYGNKLDRSRSLIVKGKRAPSFARQQLRGWGMSEVERLVRSLNQYLKNNDLIFELLDEAKIDVYGIHNLNESLSANQEKEIAGKISLSNQMKSYQNALVLDNRDNYEQKQMNFAGLSDMLQQIRIGIASDLKMPLTKIFGQSATGFNSGEDDIENYNAMIESEIRGKFDGIIIQIIKLISQKVNGFIPDDLDFKYKPLRVLSTEQEEIVKTSRVNNTMALYDRGLMTSDEVVDEINQQEIFATNLEGAKSEFPVPPPSKPKLDLDAAGATSNSKLINNLFKFKKNDTKKLPKEHITS